MAGRGRGRAFKPKSEAQKFSQRASEELGKQLGSAFKYHFPLLRFVESDGPVVDAMRGHTQRMASSPYYMPHRDHCTATAATAAAFETNMNLVADQVRGTPLVTKELVSAHDVHAAKRARTHSVSSMLADEVGGPVSSTGRARQHSFDHGADTLARREAKQKAPMDDEDADVTPADALDGMEEEATDYVTNYYEESDGEGSDGGEATL